MARRTGGRPLYAVTMALFEEEGMFVSLQPSNSQARQRRGVDSQPPPPPLNQNNEPNPPSHNQDDWLLDRATTSAYLNACETTYRAANPYHNNTHAADVTQTAAVLLRAFCGAAERPVPKSERFCVLLASAVHDLGHPGVNNDFLVRTRHRLAGLYNDRSVNENYHCATAFHLAHSVVGGGGGGGGGSAAAAAGGKAGGAGASSPSSSPSMQRPLTDLIGAPPTLQRSGADDGLGGPAALLPAHGKKQQQQQQAGGGRAQAAAATAAAANTAASEPPPPAAAVVGDGGIFSRFPLDEYARARALIVGMVLSTDMAVHFELLTSFRAAAEREGGRAPGSWADRSLAYQLLVHLADLANPSRPFPLALKWAESVVTEFLAQGDAEARSGVGVSAMCDREKISMPRAQLNFVSIFMRPTLDALAPAVPAFASAARPCLEDTVAKWEWLESAGVRLPRGDHAYPPLPGELEASRPWETRAAAAAAATGENQGQEEGEEQGGGALGAGGVDGVAVASSSKAAAGGGSGEKAACASPAPANGA